MKNTIAEKERNYRIGVRIMFTAIVATLAIITFMSLGCVTMQPQTQQQRIETGVQSAAAIGGTIILVERPQWREDVIQAVADLKTLEEKTTLTVQDVLEIVKRVDPNALKSPKAIIYINSGILLLNEAGLASQIPLAQAKSARGVARAVRAGLEQALIATAP